MTNHNPRDVIGLCHFDVPHNNKWTFHDNSSNLKNNLPVNNQHFKESYASTTKIVVQL